MPQIKCYPNTIDESDIWDLFNTIKTRNTYGYMIHRYFERSDIQVVITNENSIYNQDLGINNLTTRRGFSETSNGRKIVMHMTRYETKESVLWLILHELAHQILDSNLTLESLCYFIREKYYKEIGVFKGTTEYYSQEPHWREEYHKNEVHENDPEEIIANSFATSLIGKDLSRVWWAENIKKIDNTKSISEWEEFYDIFIIGYQGFPNETDKNTMLTKVDFLNGCLNSTLRLNQNFVAALGEWIL